MCVKDYTTHFDANISLGVLCLKRSSTKNMVTYRDLKFNRKYFNKEQTTHLSYRERRGGKYSKTKGFTR